MIEFLLSNPLVGTVVLGLWIALVLYGLSALWWLFETVVLARGGSVGPDDVEWDLSDVQVRVMTIDAEAVVQGTVASIPDEIEDVHVVAEAPIDVDGAAVHVVPESFECAATNKGRAVEWARRNVPCSKEYVLYLDEDTIVTDFHGLQDADVVQFTEKPLYTGSRIAYLSEVFRVGYQFEQFGFHRLRYPLYAWGGGVAIRKSLEDTITWDRATITEDTNFIWKAADQRDISFAVLDTRFRNQAPPSIRSMIKQRRRWISGTRADGGLLPLRYRPLYHTRIVAWALSPLVPFLVVAAVAFPGTAPGMGYYELFSLALLGMLFVYMLAGSFGYRKSPLLWPLYLALTPVAFVPHSLGALWGLLSPVETFEVTEKVEPETVEAVNDDLSEGDIADHDGTGRLRDRSGFDSSLFGDD
ncbi:glycosyltransferase [Halapricum desulfuricans]|uniref:Glycosyl transferase family 2 n=1 Tax=Halapricum desulfuricans TaxID=2841257 RepID=A0A897NDB3_9EURY|nr:glycosyltransferase family 2 protein [Halapricum desulfuricans]QSG10371.1 Glycosyl transferase family 2 [Halapricum desulfuricans]